MIKILLRVNERLTRFPHTLIRYQYRAVEKDNKKTRGKIINHGLI